MTDAAFIISFLGAIALTIWSVALLSYRGENGFWPWSETAKAVNARNAKRDGYIREYLGYGFDAATSLQKANARMEKEAADAEAL